jgi:outer membrane protein TolC
MNQTPWAFRAMLTLTLLSICIILGNTSLAGSDDNASKLDTLLKQRRAKLRLLVEVVGAQYRSGLSTLDSVIRTSDQLLKVELELAEGNEARLAIHKEQVERLESIEKAAVSRFRSGLGGAAQEESLAAQAARLGAEIELLRAQNAKQ